MKNIKGCHYLTACRGCPGFFKHIKQDQMSNIIKNSEVRYDEGYAVEWTKVKGKMKPKHFCSPIGEQIISVLKG